MRKPYELPAWAKTLISGRSLNASPLALHIFKKANLSHALSMVKPDLDYNMYMIEEFTIFHFVLKIFNPFEIALFLKIALLIS